ncbi:MAG TPA: biopolymer transporter ExbD [Puia sp.]|nr:biopolymer transporter ExbD [Puia sp.]
MAELNEAVRAGHKKQSGVRKFKKQSIRVDLTPMVDLGFLLITFFVFTTSISQPTALSLALPQDVPDPVRQTQPESGALTLLLAGHDKIFYYEKNNPHTMRAVSFADVRSVIMDKKTRTKPSDFMIILKPGPESSYRNTINILDEMTINTVKRYALVDISPDEFQWMKGSESKEQITH